MLKMDKFWSWAIAILAYLQADCADVFPATSSPSQPLVLFLKQACSATFSPSSLVLDICFILALKDSIFFKTKRDRNDHSEILDKEPQSVVS